MKEILINVLEWISNLFKLNTQKAIPQNTVPLLASDREEREKERLNKIISDSENYIKQVNGIYLLSKGTIYENEFLEVLENTKKIHKKIITDDNIPMTELSQFHKYYTFEFINTFDSALNDLKPKKTIDDIVLDVVIKNDIQWDKGELRSFIDKNLSKYSDTFVDDNLEKDIYFNPKTKQTVSLSNEYIKYYKSYFESINDCDTYVGRTNKTRYPIFMNSVNKKLKMIDFTSNKVINL